jgi:hypothetical protein
MAVQAIGGALGLSDSTEQNISAALAGAKPDDLLKLKQADQDFAEKMRQMDVDLEKLAIEDRASARQREASVKDKTPSILAYLIIGGFFLMSGAMIYCIMVLPELTAKIPQSGWLLIGSVYGYLAAEAKSAGNYYFGSSASSKEKDATISEIAKS